MLSNVRFPPKAGIIDVPTTILTFYRLRIIYFASGHIAVARPLSGISPKHCT
jgi:hypothetical protein